MESFKQKADKEYENLLNTFSKELQRLRSNQNAEKDKKVRLFISVVLLCRDFNNIHVIFIYLDSYKM